MGRLLAGKLVERYREAHPVEWESAKGDVLGAYNIVAVICSGLLNVAHTEFESRVRALVVDRLGVDRAAYKKYLCGDFAWEIPVFV
jgi:hypothetical protein